jgi:hypothetical protein
MDGYGGGILSTLYTNNVEGEIEELYQVLTGSDEK